MPDGRTAPEAAQRRRVRLVIKGAQASRRSVILPARAAAQFTAKRATAPSMPAATGSEVTSSRNLSRALRIEAESAAFFAAFFAGIVVAGWGISATAARNDDYATDTRMWFDVIQKQPKNARALTNYAANLLKTGQAKAAGVPAVAIVLDVPEDVYSRRNALRERRVEPEVLQQQAKDLRSGLATLRAEGFDQVHVLTPPEEAC